MAVTQFKTGSSFKNLTKYNDFLTSNAAYEPYQFNSIATLTPTSGTTATFSSIPGIYKSLQIRVNALVTSGASMDLTFNGDTATNYSWHTIAQDTSTVVASAGASTSNMRLFGTAQIVAAGYPLGAIIDIIDYASTTKNKTTKSFCEAVKNTGPALEIYSGMWRSTSAVTSLTITSSAAFTTGTSIALYGMK
jgi:hypothetical protein